MRVSLLVLSLLLIAACGSDEAPAPAPEPTPDAVVTPPPGAYDDDPLAAAPQEPLPDGVQPRPSPTPKPAPTPAVADEPAVIPSGPMSVAEIVLAREIVDRKPSGVSATFKDGSEVNCFTRIENPQGHRRTIRHQYFHGDELKRSLSLEVKGTTWRTWSNKRVYGPGAWRVDVVDEHGAVLKSVPFTVN